MSNRTLVVLMAAGLMTGLGARASAAAMHWATASGMPQESAPSPEEGKAIEGGGTAFSFDLYHQLSESEDGGFAFSPWSVRLAMAMAYAGARGETAHALATACGFEGAPEEAVALLARVQADLGARLKRGDEESRTLFASANRAWVNQGVQILDSYLESLAVLSAAAESIDLTGQPERSAERINAWINDATRGKIDEVIGADSLAEAQLVLVNATYFKASWKNQFRRGATKPAAFTRLDGSLVDVPMMHQTETVRHGRGDGYRAIELAYADGHTSMLVIVPDDGRFAEVEGSLSPGLFDNVADQLKHGSVDLWLPKFEVRLGESLKSALREFGAGLALTDRADFSGISGSSDFFIGDVIHEAVVTANEEGTEAAAATAVIFEATAADVKPVTITVDRPFIFVIRDRVSGAVLFLGRVTDPSV